MAETIIPIENWRRFYADEIRFASGVAAPALLAAFARVPREHFLGPPPWQIGSPEARALAMAGLRADAYQASSDPRDVYHNVVIPLDAAREINNGQPSALAAWIGALALQPGERAYHLGCGAGYYTAIIAEVVGSEGRVVASDVQPDLAARAQRNLAAYKNVAVHHSPDGVFDPGPVDAMLINAGVTHPLALWLDRLSERGRIVFPLTISVSPSHGQGVMLKVARAGDGFSASLVSPVAIFSAVSIRDPQAEPLVREFLASGGFKRLKSLRRDNHARSENCLLHAPEFCLSAD